MWNPIILSDEEENPQTPLPSLSKKPRTLPDPNILVLDVDDPTPHKSPSFVPDTPMSDVSIVKCTFAQTRDPNFHPEFLAGNAGLICLESENDEPESAKNWEEKTVDAGKNEVEERRKWRTSTNFVPVDCIVDANVNQMYGGSSSQPSLSQDDIYLIDDCPEKENFSMEQMANTLKERRKAKVNSVKENSTDEVVGMKNTKKEERIRLMEEKKLKKEQEKLQKAALKAQAAELKKMEKELQKWEKGKFALNSIVAEFDTRVIEHGSVGGLLLTKFADKGLTYRITSNPIERSILWTMSAPEHISQLSPEGTDIRYVALVYEAEDFCNLIMSESLLDHVSSVRSLYPSHTICYLTIRLMSYVNKRGKEQYKKQENDDCWRCPSVEEVLAKLTTHFVRVHYRLCTDEAELADHVFGLTRSLASCQFRKKLSQLSVNANGSFIPKDFIDRNLIKRSPWLKALVAIPKVQPRFAIAIWKKYPTMKSLLSVYMDPNKSVHEKEFLLEDLTTEGFLGGERRVGQICSKRVYRILMAQSGNIITDNVEDGADFFRHQSS
ncbi:METHYL METHANESULFONATE SENSITIVITY 4 [Salix koriyanagi]|uniref:METHYL METHANESULFONATE SENSITIVITY 4 n=1 Tax=Salix koriyanagi TaxID=2511006 RepID=A0A9Q0UPA7_9ROSI|nr:METHYL METHANESULFONATE SENSITIVITY 4 [Salix koriyanagi]